MDTTLVIKNCEEILEKNNLIPKNNLIEITFSMLIEQDFELGEMLHESYEELKQCFYIALEKRFDDTIRNIQKVVVHFTKIPDSMNIGIGSIRKENINKFYKVEGMIVKTGDVKIAVKSIRQECSSCGNIINVLQISDILRTATKCSCGSKNRFRTISEEFKNVQDIIVEEYITDYTDKKARPTVIKVALEEELCDEELSKKIQPGKHVFIGGQIINKNIEKGRQATIYSSFEIKANDIKVEDISFFNLKVPPKYIEEFKLMDKESILTDVSESTFYGIEGHKIVKEILAISRARGVKTYHEDGRTKQRDTINCLILGSPGGGKSELCKMSVAIDPIHLSVSGKGVSGAGLTGSCEFDKQLGSWSVTPGGVPRTNKGSIFIDEGDKISDDDTASLNEAMTSLSFMIVKAGQQVTLQADVNILMAANPHGRKFDKGLPKYRQITLKPDFMDRYDIWIALNKIVDRDKSKKVIGKIIDSFNTNDIATDRKYNLTFLRYYYAWIIQTFKPAISKEVGEYAKDEISKIMSKAGNNEDIDISYRLVGNVIRFGIALAKITQDNFVKKHHIDRAIYYQTFGFQSLDMIDEKGFISYEKLNFEIPKEVKRRQYTFIDILKEMNEKEKGPISTSELEKMWEEEGNDPKEVDDILDKLKNRGQIFEPRRDFFKIL